MFRNLHLNIPVSVVKWTEWGSAKSIAEYAEILSSQINRDEKIGIIGVSFGGMVAIELEKIVKPERTIIISSAKTYKELPSLVRVARTLRLDKLVSSRLIMRMPFLSRMFNFSRKDKKFFQGMMKHTSEVVMKKTIQSIILWKNDSYPEDVFHLHGGKDKVIPVNNLNNFKEVKGGGHFMIYQKGKEISAILNEYLMQKKEL